MNQLHITPRQNTYNALYKMSKREQHDMRDGIYNAVQRFFSDGILQWNNDKDFDLDFRLDTGRNITVLINVMLNAEDGDMHVRIDHVLLHKSEKDAAEFARRREEQKTAFNRIK